jgi:MraZ protein
VFRGVNTINLDVKGRMAMPVRYREQLTAHCAGRLVATIDTNARCLLLYPIQDWEEIQHKIESLPSFNATSRRIQRLLIGHATDLELDSSGRILLPQSLRDYAGLQKQLALIGQGKKLEIWDLAAWTEQRELWLSETDAEGELPENLRSLSL